MDAAHLFPVLLDSIPSSVLLVDPDLRVAVANRNFRVKARVAEADVVGKPVDAAFPPVIAAHLNLRARVADVFRTGRPAPGERMTYRAPGLATRTYYYSLTPVRAADRVGYVLLLMEDVTDQVRLGVEARRAERHLASVVAAASDLVVSTDLTGNVLSWNPAAARVTGRDEAEAVGRPLADLCPPAHRAAVNRLLRRAIQTPPEPVEVPLAGPAGADVPVAWVVSAMRDDDGKPAGLVAVGRDLSERRRLEADLRRAERLAALGVMAGGIAHEVRNPLAVASAAADLLLADPLDPQVQRECAAAIHRGVRRAVDVVDNLLKFARPSDDGFRRPVDLAGVVRAAAADAADHLRRAGAELAVDLPDGPVRVRGNPALLQQLFTNLLLNAANAMPDRGGAVRVAAEPGPPRAVVTVADTGRGIPPDDLPKVFDPFFTTMPVGRGTGLGLSICYAIAQHHDGHIDIASAPGDGTTVTVALPVGDDTLHDAGPP